MRSTVVIVVLAALSVAAPIGAQWLNHPSFDVPRTKDGKANLSARARRARDGKPDLSGIWRPEPDPQGKPEGVENEIFPRYFINIAKDLKPEEVVLRPSGNLVFKERLQSEGKNAPAAHCVPVRVPGINTFPSPFKIVQMDLHGRTTAAAGSKPLVHGVFGWPMGGGYACLLASRRRSVHTPGTA